MSRFRSFFSLVLLGALAVPGFAEVHLASPFTPHMVLQREAPVPVFGTGAPGEEVRVSFGGVTVHGPVQGDGRWQLALPAMSASAESRTFTVTGSTTAQPIVLDDVLVGEVWLASGQSNMDFTVSVKVKYFAGVAHEAEEIAAANYPLIRMFTGAPVRSATPQATVAGQWVVCSPQTVPAFSAVGYLFARDLQRRLHVPVGILTLSFGASTAESWIRREALMADPALQPMVERFDRTVATFRAHPPEASAAPRSEDVAAAPPAGRRKAGPKDPTQDQHNPTMLFNGMINPVIPYAIRGAIWYQGESIVGGPAGLALYPKVQATLVADWRKLWGIGDFPFYIVQLAGQEAKSNSPWVREAQASILKEPNTGMAVAADIGEPKNVHPKNKQDVADRLARLALAGPYGQPIEASGPVYAAMAVEGDSIRLRFTHLGGGLVAQGGSLKWFEVAGADGKFVPAEASIDGESVVVRAAGLPVPAAVRYAWVNFPDGCNLFNQAGLPAAPFRTDSWEN